MKYKLYNNSETSLAQWNEVYVATGSLRYGRYSCFLSNRSIISLFAKLVTKTKRKYCRMFARSRN